MKLSAPPSLSLAGIISSLLLLLLLPTSISAYTLNPDDDSSIREISQKVAFKMMQFYPGNKTGGIPGLFGDPYYWWESGAVFGALVDYWYYTGDGGYNAVTTEAILHQVGPDQNFMPPNQSKSLGNDDQSFWALTAMSAAEKNFPDPPSNQPQWLALVQAVFNTQVPRWDTSTCGGGLRWQIFTFNSGYDYKNTVSNGAFFHLAARLARYTGNQTYADWAVKAYDWVKAVGLESDQYKLYDGSSTTGNCSAINYIQWTYNAGLFLSGAAYMYNYTTGTEQETWKTRVAGILDTTTVFFKNSIMYEAACEESSKCNVDQRSFKAYLSRFLALTIKLAPQTEPTIAPLLRASAIAAAAQCSYGDDGNTCGMHWTNSGTWDGLFGVGEQMAALEVVQSLLIDKVPPPVTEKNGGTSKGNPAAGSGGGTSNDGSGGSGGDGTGSDKITAGDRVGAAAATLLVFGLVAGGSWWLIV